MIDTPNGSVVANISKKTAPKKPAAVTVKVELASVPWTPEREVARRLAMESITPRTTDSR